MERRFREAGKTERKTKPTREPKTKIVIVSEGKRTEPAYFEDFARANRNGLIKVETVGLGAVPLSVVDRAIQDFDNLKRHARKQGDSFAHAFEVWAVFDRDEHVEFDMPIQKAEAHKVKVAYSNPCFEVWGIMHYRAVDGNIHRHVVQRELHAVHPSYHHDDNAKLDVASLQGQPYEAALLNAEKALTRRQEEGDDRGNPSTTVHILTEKIRKHGQKSTHK